MTNAKHTATPWKIEIYAADPGIPKNQGGGETVRLMADDGLLKIGSLSRRNTALAKSNGEFIVRAVNSHEALLKAAKKILSAEDNGIQYFWNFQTTAKEIENLREAITQAEGK